MLYAICQPDLVIYGGHFPQLEEQIVPGSEPATFSLATENYLSNPSGEGRVVSKRDALTTGPRRPLRDKEEEEEEEENRK